jgi:hypothetical protein
LSLALRSTVSHPGRPDELHIIDTIVPADEIRLISQELWPELEPLLSPQRPVLAVAAVDAAPEWLRIGGGYDRPFGQDHPPRPHPRSQRGRGNARQGAGQTREPVSRHARAAPVRREALQRRRRGPASSGPRSLLLRHRSLRRNWLEAEQVLTEAIRSAADTRAGDDPDDVIAFLADLKTELAYLPHSWPNRTRMAAARLAEVADDPVPWLHASIRRSFMSEGCAFAERLAQQGNLSAAGARTLLAQPASRDEITELLVGSEPPATMVSGLAAGRPRD